MRIEIRNRDSACNHRKPDQQLEESHESCDARGLGGSAPRLHLLLIDDMYDDAKRNEDAELDFECGVGNVLGRGAGKEKESAGDGNQETEPVPPEERFGKLGRRSAFLADA